MSSVTPHRRVRKADPNWEESFGRNELDRAADAWARQRGVDLPDGKLAARQLGTREMSQERTRATLARREAARRMRDYLAVLETRLQETDWRRVVDPFARGRLERKIRVLHLRYREGLLQRQIGEAFGWKGDALAHLELARLRGEAVSGKETPFGPRRGVPAAPWAGFVGLAGKPTWRTPRRLDELIQFVRSKRRVKVSEAIRGVPLRGNRGVSRCLGELRDWANVRDLRMPIMIVEGSRERVFRWVGRRRSSDRLPDVGRRMLAMIRKLAPVVSHTIMKSLGIGSLSKFGRCVQDLRSAIAVVGGPQVIVSRRAQGYYFSLPDHYATRLGPTGAQHSA